MLRFKQYLSEAFNIGIIDPDDVPEIVSINQNKGQLKKLFNYLKRLSDEDIPLIANNTKGELKIQTAYSTLSNISSKDIRQWIKDNTPDLKISSEKGGFGTGTVGKSGKARVNENTQEIMVATLCLMNKSFDTSMSLADAIELINDAKDKFSNVEGSSQRPELLDQFNDNFNDLGTAISSANAIRKLSGNISKAYWTGKGWHGDIKSFNPPIGGVKDYNSSDVVKGTDGVYYGISLKKKGSTKLPDPTLINKPITGNKSILKGILSDRDLSKLEMMKYKFFDGVIAKHYSEHTIKDVRSMQNKEKNKLISDIPLETMGTYLKDRTNYFFIWANKILTKEPEEFCKRFIELLFRTKLGDEKDGINQNDFKFYLLTGIGQKSGQEVVSEPAEVKDLPHAIEAVTDVNKSNIIMKKTPGKLHAWERDLETGKQSKAAKLFYTIYSDASGSQKPIINLELRYKGSYTANPQFQAVATAQFKNLFK
jgi:hypothetical protein